MPTALGDEPRAVTVVAEETAFEGTIWNVRRDTFEYGDDTLVREYVHHPGAVAVLAIDEQDRVLLIRQYRHPIGMRDLELPAGLLDVDDEEPLVAAQRELAEEVDLAAIEWSLLTEFYTSPGGSNEAIRVYLARGLSAAAAFARSAEEADLELHWLSLDDAFDAVIDRRIGNAITCIAVLAAHTLRGRDWVGLGDANAPWPGRPKRRLRP